MSDMRFSGFPNGPASISVKQAGQSAELSTVAPPSSDAGIENCFFITQGAVAENWRGLSTTIKEVSGVALGYGFAPPMFRRLLQAEVAHPNRIMTPEVKDFTYAAPAYLGATADVYRMSNGALSLVRSSTVTEAKVGAWHEIEAVSSPGYTRRFDNWNRRGWTYHFKVVAVSADGLSGASSETSYHLPDDPVEVGAISNENIVSVPFVEGGALPAPQNLAFSQAEESDNAINLTWDAVDGATAYIILQSFSDPADFAPTPYLELENDGGDAVEPSDMVILSNRILAPSKGLTSARTTGDAKITNNFKTSPFYNALNDPNRSESTYFYGDWTEEDAAPGPEAGGSFAQINVGAGSGRERILQHAWAAGSTQAFYTSPTPNDLYKWQCWVEADRTVQLEFTSGLPDAERQYFTLSPGWQKIEFTFSPSEELNSSKSRSWKLYVSDRATSVTLRMAGLRMFEARTPYHELPSNLSSLVSPGTALRDHSLIKPGSKTVDIDALTNPPGVSQRGTTMESLLRSCLATGATPWFQIEWYHSTQDWENILAYLAAPVSSGHPMALKRRNNGRAQPWVDAFEEIRLEFGNESWNTLNVFWNPPPSMIDSVTGEEFGRAYIFGQICRNAALTMMASPFWTDKITWVLGGRSRNAYSKEIAQSFNLPCEVGIANYNGGWDENDQLVKENDSSYLAVLNVVPGATGEAIDSLSADLEAVGADTSNDLTFGSTLRPSCYEAGPGYQLNGLNGSSVSDEETIVQEVVMKSRASAIGTLDTMLYQAQKGFAMFNFFALREGDLWKARASTSQGGGIYPAYALVNLVFAQMGPSDILGINEVRPTKHQIINNDGNSTDAETLSVYALQSRANPKRIMLVAMNRTLTETLPVTLASAIKSVDSVTLWTDTRDPRGHNRYPVGTRLAPNDTFVPDSKCEEISYAPVTIEAGITPNRIEIDSSLGVAELENGLPPGSFAIFQLDGCVFDG